MSIYEIQESIKVINAVTLDCYRKKIKLPRLCVVIGYGYLTPMTVTYFGSDPVSPVKHDASDFYCFEVPIPKAIESFIGNLKDSQVVGIIPIDENIKDRVKEFGQEWVAEENFLLLEAQRNIVLRLYDPPSPEDLAQSRMIIEGQNYMGYGFKKPDDSHTQTKNSNSKNKP